MSILGLYAGGQCATSNALASTPFTATVNACTQATSSLWVVVSPNPSVGGWIVAAYPTSACTGIPSTTYTTPLNGCGPNTLFVSSIEVSTADIALAPPPATPYGWSPSLTAGFGVGMGLASLAIIYATVFSIVGCCIHLPSCFLHQQCKGRSMCCCCLRRGREGRGEGEEGEEGGEGNSTTTKPPYHYNIDDYEESAEEGDVQVDIADAHTGASSSASQPLSLAPAPTTRRATTKDQTQRAAFKELLKACRRGDTATIMQLLDADPALVSLTDKNLRTPLHCAAQVGSLPACTAVMAYGPNVQAKNEHGDTALDMARRFGPFEVVISYLSSARG